MNENTQKAKSILDAGEYTCVICGGCEIHTAVDRGVKPLVNWLDSGVNLAGFSAADRVVGRATAFLYCLLGVKEVYARVMSRPAVEVLKNAGIGTQADQITDGIVNRKGTGPCPFEAAVMDITDADQALAAIRQKMEQMNIR